MGVCGPGFWFSVYEGRVCLPFLPSGFCCVGLRRSSRLGGPPAPATAGKEG